MSARMRLIAEINNDRSYGGKNFSIELESDGALRLRGKFGDDNCMVVAAENLQEFIDHVQDLLDLSKEQNGDDDTD